MLMAKKTGHIIVLLLFSLSLCAEPEATEDTTNETISITVTVDDEAAAGLGYIVEGIKYGGSGKTFSGEGPRGKEYSFGYRKQHQTGIHIQCGKMILNQDSKINLVTNSGTCQSNLDTVS